MFDYVAPRKRRGIERPLRGRPSMRPQPVLRQTIITRPLPHFLNQLPYSRAPDVNH
jgi:hypothetical protein